MCITGQAAGGSVHPAAAAAAAAPPCEERRIESIKIGGGRNPAAPVVVKTHTQCHNAATMLQPHRAHFSLIIFVRTLIPVSS